MKPAPPVTKTLDMAFKWFCEYLSFVFHQPLNLEEKLKKAGTVGKETYGTLRGDVTITGDLIRA
jgi:hypothetical protein